MDSVQQNTFLRGGIVAIEIRVYFDACCFIDLAKIALKFQTEDGREPHIFFLKKFIDAARAKEVTVLTSSLSVTECTHVKDKSKSEPERIIKTDEVKRLFQGLIMSGKSGVLPAQPTPIIVEKARDLVWVHGTSLRAMDALHVATALHHKCTHFITTDNLGEENIKVINGLGLAVCSADKIAHLLADHHKQMDLSR